MKDLDAMIMGLADKNQDLSQRSQFSPPLPTLIVNRLLHWLFTVLIALLSTSQYADSCCLSQ